MAYTILMVEDEAIIARALARSLSLEGYTVDVVADGAAAQERVRRQPPDLVLLDLTLPGIDGLEVARHIRATCRAPIIILTGRDAVPDRVAGLEAGADDYVIKPFAYDELLARIRVQLRRTSELQRGEVLRLGPLELEVASRRARVDDRLVELTTKEFEVLEVLLRHAGQVLAREVIYDRVWGYNFGTDSNVIEVYISALRQKLERAGAPRMIQTVRGVGYALRLA